MKTWLVVGLLVLCLGLSAWAGPAQDILGSLAESARSERVVSGITSIGIGIGIGVGGYFLLRDLGLGSYAAIAGGLVAFPGLITLAFPSEAEVACSRACDSETDSALALERLAAAAQLSRYISGVVNVAAGVASLLFPYSYVTQYDYVYSAVLNFGMAAIDFLLPSKMERAYEQYLAVAGGT